MGAERRAPAALPARPAETLFVRGGPPGARACGHRPTARHHVITNRRTGSTAAAGRRRTRQFYDLPAGAAFAGPRRAARDPGRARLRAQVDHPSGTSAPLDSRRQGRLTPRRPGKGVGIDRRVTARAAGEVAHAGG